MAQQNRVTPSPLDFGLWTLDLDLDLDCDNMSHDSYIENIYISHVTFSLTTKLLIRFHISYSSESTRVFFT